MNKKEFLTYLTSVSIFAGADIGLTLAFAPSLLMMTWTFIPLGILPANWWITYHQNQEYDKKEEFNQIEEIKKERFYEFLEKSKNVCVQEFRNVKTLCFELSNIHEKLESKDIIILERIMFSYLPNIFDSYILMEESQRQKERYKLINSLKEIEDKLLEIKNSISREANYDFNKYTGLSDHIMQTA